MNRRFQESGSRLCVEFGALPALVPNRRRCELARSATSGAHGEKVDTPPTIENPGLLGRIGAPLAVTARARTLGKGLEDSKTADLLAEGRDRIPNQKPQHGQRITICQPVAPGFYGKGDNDRCRDRPSANDQNIEARYIHKVTDMPSGMDEIGARAVTPDIRHREEPYLL